MNSKVFYERFSREIAILGLPDELTEKTKAVSKLFGVTRYMANGMLFGQLVPPAEKLDKIAEILDVCSDWLRGATDRKKTYSSRETADTN